MAIDATSSDASVRKRRRSEVKVHEFTIIVSGFHPDRDDIANIFFEAGCDDATLAFQKGVLIVSFDREAPSFSSAVISAVENVVATGGKIERFEPDHLVSLSDIAKRAGLSRGAITNYHNGDRGENFPPPAARVTSESPLWDWCEVATWLHNRRQLSLEEVVHARIVKEANLVISNCEMKPDHFAGRMEERLRVLEVA
ncbi:hypothetical protein [Erythrobacter sp. EC-HK427]|uniref:hypothetical protein n=1 Tax=Erythrobacter sp. EC-HK427 TaxID=2038396 RepID=UPI001F23C2EE|nr:hypothetical protein [Erythrobacter sp. EC-HK427]